MFRYESPMTFRNWHCITAAVTCSYYKLQMFWREGLCRGEIRTVALDKMGSTHTPQRREDVPSVTNRIIACRIWRCSEDTKGYWKSAQSARNGMWLSLFVGFFFPLFFLFSPLFTFFFSSFFFYIFFFAKIPKAGGKHTESKRLAQSPNTVVQLKS